MHLVIGLTCREQQITSRVLKLVVLALRSLLTLSSSPLIPLSCPLWYSPSTSLLRCFALPSLLHTGLIPFSVPHAMPSFTMAANHQRVAAQNASESAAEGNLYQNKTTKQHD